MRVCEQVCVSEKVSVCGQGDHPWSLLPPFC